MVPEGLAGELVGGGRNQSRKNAVAIPGKQLGFAGGMGRTVNGGQHQILSYGEALLALGHLGVNQFDQTQLGDLVVESGDISEVGNFRSLGRKWLLGRFDGLDDVFERAQVSGLDDFGTAPDALTPPGVIIGPAFDDFAGQAGHLFRSYICWCIWLCQAQHMGLEVQMDGIRA
jgi:hypothetical protein